MSISKTANGKFRVRVYVGTSYSGGQHFLSKTVDTYPKARKVEKEFQHKKALMQGEAGGARFDEFLSDIFEPLITARVRANTWRGYEGIIRLHLLPYFGDTQLSEIKRLHIQRLINTRPTYSCAKKCFEVLRLILNEAVSFELIQSNPCKGNFVFPRQIKTPDKHNGEWLENFKQAREIIDLAPLDVTGAIIVIGLSCGLRKGEILGLDWCDVDLENGTLEVRQTYTHYTKKLQPPKTVQSERVLTLPDFAIEWLKAYKDTLNKTSESKPVLIGPDGKRLKPDRAYKLIDKFFKEHPELPRLTIYSMRHSFATSSLAAGVPVEVVSKWLGHTTVMTTYNRYVRTSNKKAALQTSKIQDAYLQ